MANRLFVRVNNRGGVPAKGGILSALKEKLVGSRDEAGGEGGVEGCPKASEQQSFNDAGRMREEGRTDPHGKM